MAKRHTGNVTSLFDDTSTAAEVLPFEDRPVVRQRTPHALRVPPGQSATRARLHFQLETYEDLQRFVLTMAPLVGHVQMVLDPSPRERREMARGGAESEVLACAHVAFLIREAQKRLNRFRPPVKNQQIQGAD